MSLTSDPALFSTSPAWIIAFLKISDLSTTSSEQTSEVRSQLGADWWSLWAQTGLGSSIMGVLVQKTDLESNRKPGTFNQEAETENSVLSSLTYTFNLTFSLAFLLMSEKGVNSLQLVIMQLLDGVVGCSPPLTFSFTPLQPRPMTACRGRPWVVLVTMLSTPEMTESGRVARERAAKMKRRGIWSITLVW